MCVILYGSNTTRNAKEGIYIHAIQNLFVERAQIGNLRAGHSGQF